MERNDVSSFLAVARTVRAVHVLFRVPVPFAPDWGFERAGQRPPSEVVRGAIGHRPVSRPGGPSGRVRLATPPRPPSNRGSFRTFPTGNGPLRAAAGCRSSEPASRLPRRRDPRSATGVRHLCARSGHDRCARNRCCHRYRRWPAVIWWVVWISGLTRAFPTIPTRHTYRLNRHLLTGDSRTPDAFLVKPSPAATAEDANGRTRVERQ
jgi:hypothetical protein